MRVEFYDGISMQTIEASPYAINTISIYAAEAKNKYLNDGCIRLAAIADGVHSSLYDALDEIGYYDDVKED